MPNNAQLLISSTAKQHRYALLCENGLNGFQLQSPTTHCLDQNIYCGVVCDIAKSLQAVFVDIGLPKLGFLRLQRKQHFTEGQRILVQVTKSQREDKGVSLSTNITLASHHVVLHTMQRQKSLARQLANSDQKPRLEEFIQQLRTHHGITLRTNAALTSNEQLQNEIAYLEKLHVDIQQRPLEKPELFYDANALPARLLGDYALHKIDKIIVDDAHVAAQLTHIAKQFLHYNLCMPAIELYQGNTPLFTQHQLNDDITHLHDLRVNLENGAYFLIEQTAALTAIDINSGAYQSSAAQKQIAVDINMAAIEVVFKHIRLREISGIIVIDLLKMPNQAARHTVIQHAKTLAQQDSAIQYMSSISYCGLIEINRRYCRINLWQQIYNTSTQCRFGYDYRASYLAYELLRDIETYIAQYQSKALEISAPTAIIDYLQHYESDYLAHLQATRNIRLKFSAYEPSPAMQYHIHTLPIEI